MTVFSTRKDVTILPPSLRNDGRWWVVLKDSEGKVFCTLKAYSFKRAEGLYNGIRTGDIEIS